MFMVSLSTEQGCKYFFEEKYIFNVQCVVFSVQCHLNVLFPGDKFDYQKLPTEVPIVCCPRGDIVPQQI